MKILPLVVGMSMTLLSAAVSAQSGGVQLPTTPPASSVVSNKFGQEVSQVTQNKMRSMGFASNDPRYSATLNGISKKAAERSAQFKVDNPAMSAGYQSTSWVSSFLGSVSNFFSGVGIFFGLSYLDPTGDFGWMYCPEGDRLTCFLKKTGSQLPVADPTVYNPPSTNVPSFYCMMTASSGFTFTVNHYDGSSHQICLDGTQGHFYCASSSSSVISLVRAYCPGLSTSYRNDNGFYRFVDTWKSDFTLPQVGSSAYPAYRIWFNSGGSYIQTTDMSVPTVYGFSSLPEDGDDVQGSCPAGQVDVGAGCQVYGAGQYFDDNGLPLEPPVLPEGMTIGDAIENLENTPLTLPAPAVYPYGQNQLSAPLSPQLAPYFINDAWKDLSDDPDYFGVPFPYSDPVSPQDVLDYREQYPDYAPRVGDFVKPLPIQNPDPVNQPDTEVSPNPWQLPEGAPSPNQNPDPVGNPTPNPGTNPDFDLGPDPGIGSPDLEPIPEPGDILAPLINLFPDLRSFQMPSHDAVCPQPTVEIDMLDVNTQMTSHCDILEDNRALIFGFMILIWTCIAIFLILSA